MRAGADTKGRVWVAFDAIPDDETRATLRAIGMQWHSVKMRWVGPATDEARRAVFVLTGHSPGVLRVSMLNRSVDAFERLGKSAANVRAFRGVRGEWVDAVCVERRGVAEMSRSGELLRLAVNLEQALGYRQSDAREARNAASYRYLDASRSYRRLMKACAVIDWHLSRNGGGDALSLLTAEWAA